MSTRERFHVDAVSLSYWRVTFDHGPVNLLDPDTLDQLGALTWTEARSGREAMRRVASMPSTRACGCPSAARPART